MTKPQPKKTKPLYVKILTGALVFFIVLIEETFGAI